MSGPIIFYSVRDHTGADHLAGEHKRTLCGLIWLTTDRMFGFAVGHQDDTGPYTLYFRSRDCERCLVVLENLRGNHSVGSQHQNDEEEDDDDGMPF